MNIPVRSVLAAALAFGTLSLLAPGGALTAGVRQQPEAPAAAPGENAWPQTIETQGYVITVYQPQTDRFEGDTLEGRAAVSVKRADGSGDQVFGAVWLVARLDIDRDARVAWVRRVTVPDVRFPDASEEQRKGLVQLLEREMPTWDLSIDLDRLVADLDNGEAGLTTPGLKSEPPRFVFSAEPAVLLAYDGKPVVKAAEGAAGLEGVVNTPFPVVREKGGKAFYLFGGGDLWYSAPDPMGPWSVTTSVPAAVAKVAEAAETSPAVDGDAGPPPKIVVATVPTELIVTDGDPKWSPIAGGDLLFCSNTESDVFLEISSQRYFIAAGGRWFAGRSLGDTIEWVNIRNDELPEAFADIPEDSPKASVLVHVAGTVPAREEALENVIPQVAAVKRSDASLAVKYDGAPKFEPVKEAQTVSYAVNTASAVFKVGATYYACDNAIWYKSPSPTGPWEVAAEIPSVLYTVPPSNPHHNVTYVRVYDVTPTVVYVGYTPGYVGSYWSHGCIVYGTGWYYSPWYGPYYYPRPWTWGLHVSYNPWYGWGVGVSWSNGPFRVTVGWRSGPYYRPPYYGGWYGPGGYRPPYYRPYPPPGYRPPGYRPVPTPYAGRRGGPGAPSQLPARGGVYDRPAVANRMAPGTAPANRARPTPAQMPNDVFTDRNGNVYKRNPAGGWDQRQGGQWKPADGLDRPAAPATRPATPAQPSAPAAGRGGGAATRPAQPGQVPATRPGGAAPAVRPPTAGQQPSMPGVSRPPTGATRPQLERDSLARQRGATRSGSAPIRRGGRGGR